LAINNFKSVQQFKSVNICYENKNTSDSCAEGRSLSILQSYL